MNPTVFEKTSSFENCCGRKGGYHVSPSQNFGFTGPENFLTSLQCSGRFGVSKNFMQNVGYNIFPSSFFCDTEPRTFVGEHFGVSENSGYRKILSIRGGWGEVSRFSVENFCHTVPKKFVGEHFGVSKNFLSRKI